MINTLFMSSQKHSFWTHEYSLLSTKVFVYAIYAWHMNYDSIDLVYKKNVVKRNV